MTNSCNPNIDPFKNCHTFSNLLINNYFNTKSLLLWFKKYNLHLHYMPWICKSIFTVQVTPCALLKDTSTLATEEGESISHLLPPHRLSWPGIQTSDLPAPFGAGAWVAAPSLNTHCEAIEHNETACTQALSDDMPSMHQPNLHPLLPYEMHLLYVIMLFEEHRQRDINSTSVFGQLIPSVHSTACRVIGSLHAGNKASMKPFKHTSNRPLLQLLYQILVKATIGQWQLEFDKTVLSNMKVNWLECLSWKWCFQISPEGKKKRSNHISKRSLTRWGSVKVNPWH